MASCVGGGVFFKQRLTGKYALWAVEGLAGSSLVEESGDGAACRVLVGPTVFSAGFDERFIIVARHPKTGPLEFDRMRTEYHVVTIADGAVHGPAADEDSFARLRLQLQVPGSLQFSVTLQQLARGQSANQSRAGPGREGSGWKSDRSMRTAGRARTVDPNRHRSLGDLRSWRCSTG